MSHRKRDPGRLLWVVAAAIAVALVGITPAAATGPQAFPGAHIHSWTSGRCLDVDAGTENNPRTNVQLYDCRPSSDWRSGYQKFDQISIPGRPHYEFKLRNQRTGKCLSYRVLGGDQSPVWAEQCDRNGQGWRHVAYAPDVHQFVAVETHAKCLDAVDIYGGHRTGIDLFSCSPLRNYNSWFGSYM